jgi:BatD DUF11 like domain
MKYLLLWKKEKLANYIFICIFIMKKYLLVLMFLFLFYSVVFAGNQVLLQTDTDTAAPGESIEVILQVQADDTQIQDVTIPGIENFEVFSTSESRQVQMYNTQVRHILTLTLDIRGKQEGIYTLWPVLYGTGSQQLSSEVLTLDIKKSTSQKPTLEKQKLDDSLFRDELRPVKSSVLYWIFALVWVFLFLWFFYFLSQKYFSEKLGTIVTIPEKKEISMKQKLLNYSKNYASLDDQHFFSGLNLLLREYFASLWVSSAYEKTYAEISLEKNIPESVKKSFQVSYFAEFENQELSHRSRESIFEEIISHF